MFTTFKRSDNSLYDNRMNVEFRELVQQALLRYEVKGFGKINKCGISWSGRVDVFVQTSNKFKKLRSHEKPFLNPCWFVPIR